MGIGAKGQHPPFCYSAARLNGAGGITPPTAPLKNKKNERGEAPFSINMSLLAELLAATAPPVRCEKDACKARGC